MKRIVGFASFCVATGMAVVLVIPDDIWCMIILLILLLLGYRLFCCK